MLFMANITLVCDTRYDLTELCLELWNWLAALTEVLSIVVYDKRPWIFLEAAQEALKALAF